MNDNSRELSAFDIGCVVVGGIIGVGIFFTPQRVAVAVDTPGQVLLAWGLGGALAVLGAIVFAELSLAVPGHGGTFRYLQQAFGPRLAFYYGWANWLVIQAGAAGIVALLLVNHLRFALWPEAEWSETTRVLAAAAVVLGFTAINVVGLRTGKRVQNALTVLKVLALAWLVTLAWFEPRSGAAIAPPAPSGRSLPAMLAAAMLPVLFATGGWQQGSFVAGAARHRRSVALGILGGVAVVVVTYMTVNSAYLDLLGFEGARASSEIGAAAAEAALGADGGRVLAAMVVVSAAGILNTICLAPPYVLYALAQERCFPAAFGRLHSRFGTPVLGVLGQGLWAVLLLLLAHWAIARLASSSTQDTLGFVTDGVVYVDWLFFMLCGVALLTLRSRGATRAPFGGVVALAFTLGAATVTIGAIWVQPVASLVGTLLVLAGTFFRPRRASR
ncbi:MAG: APC family permease [Planctomycetes bacterium]|nr:APC family permease [Planctomycetota bacterium]